jgi:hypothetical protein
MKSMKNYDWTVKERKFALRHWCSWAGYMWAWKRVYAVSYCLLA